MLTLLELTSVGWWEAVGGLYVQQQQRILDWSRLATGWWSQGRMVTSLYSVASRPPASCSSVLGTTQTVGVELFTGL